MAKTNFLFKLCREPAFRGEILLTTVIAYPSLTLVLTKNLSVRKHFWLNAPFSCFRVLVK